MNQGFLSLSSFILAALALWGCKADPIPTQSPAPTPAPRVITQVVQGAITMPASAPTAVAAVTATLTMIPAVSPTPFITAPAPGESVIVPILMYHHLKTIPSNASLSVRTWTVSPAAFAEQLDYLLRQGYHAISFAKLTAHFASHTLLPIKPILLTFDDDWIEHYTIAFPELKKRGMVGTFFVPTAYADAHGNSFMSWDQILEMEEAGMEFGGHTLNHIDMKKADPGEVRRQLSVSKEKMDNKLGHLTGAFAYPFGAFNPSVVQEVSNAGYQAAVILCCGYKQRADARMTMPRIRISYDDPIEQFINWLPPID